MFKFYVHFDTKTSNHLVLLCCWCCRPSPIISLDYNQRMRKYTCCLLTLSHCLFMKSVLIWKNDTQKKFWTSCHTPTSFELRVKIYWCILHCLCKSIIANMKLVSWNHKTRGYICCCTVIRNSICYALCFSCSKINQFYVIIYCCKEEWEWNPLWKKQVMLKRDVTGYGFLHLTRQDSLKKLLHSSCSDSCVVACSVDKK